MRNCKDCGREEFGYGSILNEDGYCPTCASRHNDGKIKELKQELKIRIDDNADLYAKLCNSLTQLEEANKVIKKINSMSGNVDLSKLSYQDRRKVDGITSQTYEYLKKWGVE